MKLELVSKHRSELMALAMFWVAIYHSYFPISFKPISFFLVTCGYGGVDVFLFLSSFGLYYASKKENAFIFIKKRLTRILPYTIIINLLYMLILKKPLFDTIVNIFGLSYFIFNNFTNWFTLLILCLYFITPLYIKIFHKNEKVVTLLSVFIVIFVCLLINNNTVNYWIFRIAIYLLGFYFAYLNDENKYNKTSSIILIVLAIFGWIFLYYLFHNFGNDVNHVYPFLIIVPGQTILLAWIVEKIKFVQKPLSFIGKYTYQHYLIHEQFLSILYKYYGELFIAGIGFDWWINIAGILFALLFAIIIKTVLEKMHDIIIKKKRVTT